MIQKYSFIPVFSCILLSLAWWTTHLRLVQSQTDFNAIEEANSSKRSRRIELVETLDKLVAYEHYYHSVYGHFTKVLNRIGFRIPTVVTDVYDIQVAEANTDRLLVTALSELNGRTKDVISIDQDYQVHANFDLPLPRAEYVKTRAVRHLRLLRDAPNGQSIAEDGVFKGYFRYSTQLDSKSQKIVMADGVRPPVLGIHLEVNDQNDGEVEWSLNSDSASEGGNEQSLSAYSHLFSGVSSTVSHTGQIEPQVFSSETMASLEEEAYLAQQIFHGEVGRYAKTWSELSDIVHFRFEGKDQFDLSQGVPTSNLSIGYGLEKDRKTGSNQEHSSDINRQITSTSHPGPLEIEPISAGSQ